MPGHSAASRVHSAMERVRRRKYSCGLPQLALIQAKEAGVATPPRPPASTIVTFAPALARCQAIEAPMMPAPTTMISLLVAIPQHVRCTSTGLPHASWFAERPAADTLEVPE